MGAIRSFSLVLLFKVVSFYRETAFFPSQWIVTKNIAPDEYVYAMYMALNNGKESNNM